MKPVQRGIALIESLVALVIVSIVFIAMAGLQAKGLMSSNVSSQRTRVTSLATSMSDRIRANGTGYRAGNYDSLTAAPSDPQCIGSGGCTPAQLAQTDFYLWRDEITSTLPGGSGVVCVDSTPDDGTAAAPACDAVAGAGRLVVKIWWDNKETGVANRYVMTFYP